MAYTRRNNHYTTLTNPKVTEVASALEHWNGLGFSLVSAQVTSFNNQGQVHHFWWETEQ